MADGITDEHGQLIIEDHQKGTTQYTVKLGNGHEIELPVKEKLQTDDDKLAAQGFRHV
jgi:type VI secretion system secreted protein VgrG